jgi:hypothetical protein
MTSPFLPNTTIQFAWDSTSLGWLKECPRKYQYSMLEGWRANSESVHLKFGLLYHTALEHYDRLKAEGTEHNLAVEKVSLEAMLNARGWRPDHPYKTLENLVRSIIWYLDEFKDDPTQTIVLQNGKPAVELSFRMELDWGPTGQLGSQPYLLCGHIDRLVTFAEGTYVMDRKTTGSTPGSSYFDGFSPDNQMSLYSLASKVVYKTPVKGVIIDAAQIQVGATKFARGFTYRSDTQLAEWLDDTHYWLDQSVRYAQAGHWPQNDKSCHNFGGCVFRRVCSKSPDIREKFLQSDFHREEWNPLIPR